jgi:hypothetical protein
VSWGDLVATQVSGVFEYKTYVMTEEGQGITILKNDTPFVVARFNEPFDAVNVITMPGKEVRLHLNNGRVK